MIKCLSALFVMAALLAPCAMSQELTPVWEYININSPAEHPWLRAETGTNWEHDGTNTMDFFSALCRYDEERMMLLIIENGINEAEATTEEASIAERFPDRSIIWINAGDGAPMGVAINLGIDPTGPDSEYYIQKCSGTHPDGPEGDRTWQLIEQWPTFSVDDDGYVYVVDKHKIGRYTPAGDDTFTGPEVVYTYPEQDPPVWAVSESQHYRAWCIRSINVKGSGPNKVMTTAARFWIDGGGVIYYTSDDGGATWTAQLHRGQEQRGNIGTGGAASLPVTDDNFGEEWVFSTGFPGSDRVLYRFVRGDNVAPDTEFEQDTADYWDPEADPDTAVAEVDRYMKWEMTDVAAQDGVPFVAVLTLPKWQSRGDENFNTATSWVAINSISLDPNDDGIEGDFLDAYQIDSREGDETQASSDDDNWDAAYLATINMYVNPGYAEGAAEILWSGGNNGFGRLVVGDTNVNDWSIY